MSHLMAVLAAPEGQVIRIHTQHPDGRVTVTDRPFGPHGPQLVAAHIYREVVGGDGRPIDPREPERILKTLWRGLWKLRAARTWEKAVEAFDQFSGPSGRALCLRLEDLRHPFLRAAADAGWVPTSDVAARYTRAEEAAWRLGGAAVAHRLWVPPEVFPRERQPDEPDEFEARNCRVFNRADHRMYKAILAVSDVGRFIVTPSVVTLGRVHELRSIHHRFNGSMRGSDVRPLASPTGAPLPRRQREVLEKLDGRALSLKDLAKELDCDPSRLRRDHLKPLMNAGHIKNDRAIGGYYRPDAPPALG
ncbi:MAG TPA: hypothetical protein VFG68_22110 [Fimbriiglobus sp.]|nr:hypothetical protein [Fimbriiglobus sp.]